MPSLSRTILIGVVVLMLSAVLLICVIGGGVYLWARGDARNDSLNPVTLIRLKMSLPRHEDDLTRPAGTDDRFIEFEITSGEGAYTVANNLLAAGLITDAGLFVDYVRYYGLDSRLQAGTYFLQQTQTLEQIAYALTDASSATIPFRTLAGWRIEEIAEFAVGGNTQLNFGPVDFLSVVGPGAPIPDAFRVRMSIPATLSNGAPASLEGFMAAGDYRLRPDVTALELRDTLLEAFDQNVTDAMLQQAAAQGLTFFQVVTLASIVQREAVDLTEAPIIASVYLNRLRLPMKLDADPTVQYAIGTSRDGRWWPSITQADYYGLDTTVPNQSYSTYLHDGLPPGPICSPSLAAIRAVLEPAQTQYLYFRAGCAGDGRHVFFTNQAEHANFSCN